MRKAPQRRNINRHRPNRMPQQPRLLLLPILPLRLLLTLNTVNPPRLRHPLNRPGHQRRERKMPRRQNGAVGVPVTDIARLQRGVRLQPARGEGAGGGGCEGHTGDEGGAKGEGVVPEAGEGFAGDGGVGAEEGEEDGELVEGETEGY